MDLLNLASLLICAQPPSLPIHQESKPNHFVSLQHRGEGKWDLENATKQLRGFVL